MVSSMTGFGQAAVDSQGTAFAIEIKTVNNRYLKTSIRLPDVVSFLEGDVEKVIRKGLDRGTVQFALNMKNVSDLATFDLDDNALQGYITKLKTVAKLNDIECTIDLADMLTLPGIIQPMTPDAEQAENMRKVVLELTEEALEKVRQVRLEEGKSLADDMLKNCGIIADTLAKIAGRSPIVVGEYHDRIKKRAEELLAQGKVEIDEDVLARETAIFADRSDISEEVTRLGTHLEQFEKCCSGGKSIGRRLDFMTQEMLREANTIASKASDSQIGQWVIDIKCCIDRIKEQVQNVE